MTEHEACPFCGSGGEDLRVWAAVTGGYIEAHVYCDRCDARGPTICGHDIQQGEPWFVTSREEMDAAWRAWDQRAEASDE